MHLINVWLSSLLIDKTYFEPDISVICDKDKLTDKDCNGAADWIIDLIK